MTLPEAAVQLVAPGAVNCWVCVNVTLTDTGEITGAVGLFSNVTVAVDWPAAF